MAILNPGSLRRYAISEKVTRVFQDGIPIARSRSFVAFAKAVLRMCRTELRLGVCGEGQQVILALPQQQPGYPWCAQSLVIRQVYPADHMRDCGPCRPTGPGNILNATALKSTRSASAGTSMQLLQALQAWAQRLWDPGGQLGFVRLLRRDAVICRGLQKLCRL